MNYNVPYAEADEQGRIVSWGELSPHSFLHQINPNYVFATGSISPALQYVKAGVIRERPIMAIRRDGMRFYELPQPCEVWINGRSYPVENGELELDLPQPGIYTLRFVAWPFQDADIQLEVTA
ncbi:hypothetical protein [Chromobacterium sp.]|uniref:hypothetical protein n=1 Tax=Chromobacterium sp. TaxID=306190 RepID=UPI0035B348FD